MKMLYALVALAILFGPAAAQTKRDSTWQPGVPAAKAGAQPTGYQIRGCAHHETVGPGEVRQICNERDVQNFFPRQEARGEKGGGN